MKPTVSRRKRALRRPPAHVSTPSIASPRLWLHPGTRFSLVFVAIVIVLSGIALVDEASFDGAAAWVLCSKLAAVVAATMRWFDADVVSSGNQIRYGAFTCDVVPECTGIDLVGLFLAAVCAFPCAWKSKVRGLGIGVPLLLVLNVIRVVALVAVGAHWPEVFEVSHLYVAPLVVLTTTLGLWLAWADQVSRDAANV